MPRETTKLVSPLDDIEVGKIERLVKSLFRKRKPVTRDEIVALGNLIKSAVGYSVSMAAVNKTKILTKK